MDSLTQAALGAAVSVAVIGKPAGPRKAALIGLALGTLPDLDVLIPFEDPIDSFVYHRGWSHAFFVHALAAPVIGEGLVRLFSSLREHRLRVYLAVFFCFVTHAVIDAMTIYGTRIFWPFDPDPVGVGSIFIIDPIYSVPILIVVIWSLFKARMSLGLFRALTIALVVSSAYMALGVGLQTMALERAKRVFAEAGLAPIKLLATAGPFNMVLWKVTALEEDRYHNVYLSFLDEGDNARIYTHPRRADLLGCLRDSEAVQKLDWFSGGFIRADEEDGSVYVSDLRMGYTPSYVFRFKVAETDGDKVEPQVPVRDFRGRNISDEDVAWLQNRIMGVSATRVSEVLTDEKDDGDSLQC